MNRLIIIGNGFDLAHGLKTSYKDFIQWYWTERLWNLSNCNTDVSDDILSCLKNNQEKWSLYYFFNLNGRLKEENALDFLHNMRNYRQQFSVELTPFFEKINTSIETRGWVDIEKIYYDCLLACHNNSTDDYSFPNMINQELSIIKDYLIKFLKEKIRESAKKKDEEIQNIFISPIEAKDLSISFKSTVEKNSQIPDQAPENTFILNFNYTSTPEQYIPQNLSFSIDYIHGNLDNPDSIIFGYGDELDDCYKSLVKNGDKEYLRNIKSIKYLESDNYRRLLSFIESLPYQILILGHSCGLSDGTLLNTLFEHPNCISIKPYYYRWRDAKGKVQDNYMDILQNIARNFTDMKLMRDRIVNKTYCEELSQIEKQGATKK